MWPKHFHLLEKILELDIILKKIDLFNSCINIFFLLSPSYELPAPDQLPPGSTAQPHTTHTPVACVTSVPEAPPTYCVMSQGGPGATYWMPMMAMPGPYQNNVNQPVNLSWGPSHDPYGKDLPISGES